MFLPSLTTFHTFHRFHGDISMISGDICGSPFFRCHQAALNLQPSEAPERLETPETPHWICPSTWQWPRSCHRCDAIVDATVAIDQTPLGPLLGHARSELHLLFPHGHRPGFTITRPLLAKMPLLDHRRSSTIIQKCAKMMIS